jgi:NAD(P)-dependent dehydrogenase (short-subunit alcohol dehydrogenase family)
MNTQKTNTKRVALVTGANRGIGFEIARQLAQKDMIVVMGARDEEKGTQTRERLAEEGLKAHFTLLDVTEPTSIQAALGKLRDAHGRLDVLVNNAGVMIDGDTGILALSLATLRNTLETNTFGPLLLSQACVPVMQRGGYGRIVNLSSTLGSLAGIMNPDSDQDQILSPAYRMSKTLLNATTALLAKELRGSNILVNSVCPGWVRTDMGGPRAPLDPAQAAATPVWLATLPDGGPTGGFFRERQLLPW